MATVTTEVCSKRRMEDITNCHKKAKVNAKAYFATVQERSPSPSSPCSMSSPPKHARQKSVSFELSRNQHFEHSPLLTPKDEDYDLDSDHNDEKPHEEELGQLDSNPDYMALTSTVNLLNSTKERIEADLSELAMLKAQAANGSKSDLVEFYVRLICDKPSLPAQHKIVKAPSVSWGKYHKGLSDVCLGNDCTNNNETSIFETLNLFGSST